MSSTARSRRRARRFGCTTSAACVVGAARFYNRARLNSSLLIASGGPVIYAANLFAPKPFVMAKAGANASYGEDGHDCCAVNDKDAARRRAVCGDDCEAAPTVRVDKVWLAAELRSVLEFRARQNVPVYIDQFGVHADAPGAPASVSRYLADALELFEGERLHWTLWIWRRPWGGANHTEWTCNGFAVVCQPSEGAAYTLHEPVLASVAPYVGARAPAV